jgi:hypothetical protein
MRSFSEARSSRLLWRTEPASPINAVLPVSLVALHAAKHKNSLNFGNGEV